MKSVRQAVGAVVVAAFAGTTTLPAQSAQPFSLQGSMLYAALFGDAYEGIDNGFGFEAQARYNPGALSIGAGFQYTSHPVTGLDENVTLIGGFLEPRYVIIVGSNVFAPYVSSRLAVLQQRLEIGSVSGKATGVQINFGGGVLFRLTTTVNLDVGATYGYINFGDSETTSGGGQTIQFETGSGQNLVLRAGIALGIGK